MSKEEVSRPKQLSINIIATIVAFAVNVGISFFLTPYIVDKLGVEANGFLGLANNFINYASLLTVALHSMAGRFITLKICEDDYKEANIYFNSVFVSNVILTIIAIIMAIVSFFYLQVFIKIPSAILWDVKIMFTISFLNFAIGIMTSVFSISFFATNKLYISSLRGIQSNVLRAVIILVGFIFFRPQVMYVTLGAMVASIFVLVCDVYYSKKLLPEIKIDLKLFEMKKVIQLTSSGFWNTLIKLSQIFTSGMDLLLSIMFINATAMGILTLAKTVPNVIINLFCSIAGVFSPEMTIFYGKNQHEELRMSIKQSMRFLCVFVSIPNSLLIAYGTEFFQLWQPSQDARLLQILSIMTVINSCVTGPIQPLYQVFTITDKVKESAKVLLIFGIVSILLNLVLLKYTNLGLYIIAGVSLVGSVVVALAFHIPRSATLLGLKWNAFYGEVFLNIGLCIAIIVIGYGIKYIIVPNNWLTLIISASVCGVIALILEWFVLLTKGERNSLLNKVRGVNR